MAKNSSPMAAVAWFVLFLISSAGVRISNGEVYKVGDSTGWTTQGNPNYTAWASTKTFHVGDTLLFEYHNEYHNVLVVSKADYQACSNSSAITTYTTGNDSIPLKSEGHHFFLCGFPTHCSNGQKVDILASSAAPSSAPSESNHAPITPKGLGLALSTLALAALSTGFIIMSSH